MCLHRWRSSMDDPCSPRRSALLAIPWCGLALIQIRSSRAGRLRAVYCAANLDVRLAIDQYAAPDHARIAQHGECSRISVSLRAGFNHGGLMANVGKIHTVSAASLDRNHIVLMGSQRSFERGQGAVGVQRRKPRLLPPGGSGQRSAMVAFRHCSTLRPNAAHLPIMLSIDLVQARELLVDQACRHPHRALRLTKRALTLSLKPRGYSLCALKQRPMARFTFGFFLAAAVWAPLGAHAQSTDDSLRIYAVNFGTNYGVYLGKGLIITAAHVVGSPLKPTRAYASLARTCLPSAIKEGNFEREDLTLLSIDEQKLPVSLRMRRMPLCERPPWPGEPVIVAVPEGTARSRIMSPQLLPRDVRTKFPTVISDVATTGNSGSGVFDAGSKCLLGIMSRRISLRPNSADAGEQKDIAKYFVPASTIRAFIPTEYRF